ncbi:MAG: DnrO protein, partial [Lysobacteraceae bacterium]
MKPLLLVVLLLASAGVAYGHDPISRYAAHTASASVAKHPATTTHRWHADAPLKAGMARVRIASDGLMHMQHGHLDQNKVRALADGITAAVNYMFANCKLDPAPDAALHPLLAKLLADAQALQQHPTDSIPV